MNQELHSLAPAKETMRPPSLSSWPRLPPRLEYGWYSLVRTACMLGTTVGFSLRMEGQRHIPTKGPALLIANHQSFLDPVLVAMASPRHLCFLARKTLFRRPAFAWLIDSLNAVPVDQEGVGKEGLKVVLQQLQN